MGASGWSYSDILPYYRRLENVDYTGSEEVENLRGINGPLNITKGKRMNPLTLAFEKLAHRQVISQLQIIMASNKKVWSYGSNNKKWFALV